MGIGLGLVRPEADGFVEVGDRPVVTPFLLPAPTSIDVRRRVARGEPDDLGEGVDRPVVLPLELPLVAPVERLRRVVGIDPDDASDQLAGRPDSQQEGHGHQAHRDRSPHPP